jgi:2'-hydroxyisoflavone reductase
MRLLILGGTVFLGRHLCSLALEGGHEITIFNRGQHNPDLFPDVERLRGDRASDLESLRSGQWDVVIDTSGYFPGDVRATAELLRHRAQLYVFVSSISVYADVFHQTGIDEDGRLFETDDPGAREVTGDNYGALKALCERAALEAFGNSTCVVRPGLIVGPFDPSDRFTYWPHRVGQGGRVLVPETMSFPIQIVDVRDLAQWILGIATHKLAGTFNATSLPGMFTLGHVLEASREVSGSDAEFTCVDASWLVDQGVRPWTEMPLWVPNAPGFSMCDPTRAVERGLTVRPIRETVADTLLWDKERRPETMKAGIRPDREQELLALWDSHVASGRHAEE